MTREEFINWFEERFALTKNDIYELGKLYDEATKPHWISVEDELPNNYEPVIAAFDRHFARVCFHCGDTWYLDNPPVAEPMSGITHWMPLPQPPTEEIRGNQGEISPNEKGGDQ